MPPTIGAYREIAAGSAHPSYSQRVTLGHNNNLVKADRWGVRNRLVQWNNPTQQIPEKNWLYRLAKRFWFNDFGVYDKMPPAPQPELAAHE